MPETAPDSKKETEETTTVASEEDNEPEDKWVVCIKIENNFKLLFYCYSKIILILFH